MIFLFIFGIISKDELYRKCLYNNNLKYHLIIFFNKNKQDDGNQTVFTLNH